MKCRLCSSKTKNFLYLGKVSLPEEFRTKSQLKNPIKKYPLGLSYCVNCSHVQLEKKIKPDLIYKQNYFYDYSITLTGDKHWQEMAKTLSIISGGKGLVVDIGSNTGSLLLHFKKRGYKIAGIDPNPKLSKIAIRKGVPTEIDYFGMKAARNIIKKNGQAQIITCNNTYDHVDDLTEFMIGIKTLLSDHGIFVVEVPYFAIMLRKLTHIPYHQQVDYMMLTPFLKFVEKFGFEVFDGKKINTHGGSIRIFIGKKGLRKKSRELKNLLANEILLMKNWDYKLQKFSDNLLKQRDDFMQYIKGQKSLGKKIAGIGASAKGITLLNYSNFDHKTIEFITEKSVLKVGRFTPSGIPVEQDHKLFEEKIDIGILLAWNFIDEVIQQFSKKDIEIITPVPQLKKLR